MGSMSIPFMPETSYCNDYEVQIVEEPAPKAQRFRYETEVDRSRTQGSLPGISSIPGCLTYPTISVTGKHGPYHGPMFIIVCLLNPEDDLIHPHTILGKAPRSENDNQYVNRRGVLQLTTDGPEVIFQNIGIICVKKKNSADVIEALRARKEMRLDPFKQHFEHMKYHNRINFSAVRLCFNVFLPEECYDRAVHRQKLKYPRPLRPKCSIIIYDTKNLTDLKIIRMNTQVKGGAEMLLFCEKFTGETPDVIFEREGWAVRAQNVRAHRRCGLYFKVPPYEGPACNGPIEVSLYLQKTNARGQIERSERAVVEYIEDAKHYRTPLSAKNYLSSIKQKALPQLPLEQEPMLPSTSFNMEWLPQPSTSPAIPREPQCPSAPTNDSDGIYMFVHGNTEPVEPGTVCDQPEPRVQVDELFYPVETPPQQYCYDRGVSPKPNVTYKEDNETANQLLYPPADNNHLPVLPVTLGFDDCLDLQTPYDLENEIEMLSDELLKKIYFGHSPDLLSQSN